MDQNNQASKQLLRAPDAAAFIVELGRVFAQKHAKGAVLKLYLEQFKQFNDTFGYDYGEMLLSQVMNFLERLPGCRVFRYGGVEFMLLMENANYSTVMETAEAIQERFDTPWRIDQMDYMCLMSLGLYFYSEGSQDPREIVKSLEHAVAEASQTGQNALMVFDTKLREKVIRRQGVAKLISRALLSEHGIEVRYRPTYDVAKKKFTRAECYLRIISGDHGIVTSAEFLPVAEDSGQICAVNSYMIEEVCKQIRALLDKGVEFESIAAPISPIQFLQETFLEDLEKVMKTYKIPAGKLGFELSESMVINAFQKVNMVMQDLTDMGVEIILNDFGTGYSGITNILDLPVDVVKLERSFIWQLETNPRSGYLIEGLVQIANNLGVKVIAEGVETDNQVELLAKYGCPYAQGFYYSATVTPEELPQVLGKGLEAL